MTHIFVSLKISLYNPHLNILTVRYMNNLKQCDRTQGRHHPQGANEPECRTLGKSNIPSGMIIGINLQTCTLLSNCLLFKVKQRN